MTANQANPSQLNASRVAASPMNTSRLRLTRRGRLVLTSIFAAPLAVLVLATALNGGMATANSDLATGSFEYVTVQTGQSLWELAETIAPAADPREVISDIVRLNQMENSELHPGDQLAIPNEYSR